VKHEERAQLARDIIARMVAKYPDDIVLGGVYGSTATGTDTGWSDLELQFVVRDGSKVRQKQFTFKDTAVGLFVLDQGKLEKRLTNPSPSWPFLMGVLSVLKVECGDPEQLQAWLRLGQAVPMEKFREALEESLPGLVTESHGRIHSCIERGSLEDIGCAVIEVMFEMRDALCLLNRRWVTHDYYQGLMQVCDFQKQPRRYKELVRALHATQDPQELARLSDALVSDFWQFLAEEGIKVVNYTRAEDLPL